MLFSTKMARAKKRELPDFESRAMTEPAIILHGTPLSGHAHRVELLLLMLGLSYRIIDAPASVRKTPAFRALNPLEQIPVLQDGDLTLADSNAILVYLASYAAMAASCRLR